MAELVYSREQIEQTLTERMRDAVVNLGLLPDVRLFLPANEAGYIAARQAIITGGNEIIDVFGIGSAEVRGEKAINKIFMNLRQFTTGSVAHSDLFTESYDDNGTTKFREVQVNGSTMNMILDVRSVVKSTKYDRYCTEAIMRGMTQSIQGIFVPILDSNGDPTEDTFLLKFVSSQEIKGKDFFERLYTFEAQDIWIGNWDAPIVRDNIPMLTRITNCIFANDADADIINIE